MPRYGEEKTIQRAIGRAMVEARHQQGLTRAALAMRVGVETGQIIGYETGSYMIGAARLALVADALGLSIEHFLMRDRDAG
jgi:transcriptional regulator with XRE-family HTH domain